MYEHLDQMSGCMNLLMLKMESRIHDVESLTDSNPFLSAHAQPSLRTELGSIAPIKLLTPPSNPWIHSYGGLLTIKLSGIYRKEINAVETYAGRYSKAINEQLFRSHNPGKWNANYRIQTPGLSETSF